jgi:hypothetical protein
VVSVRAPENSADAMAAARHPNIIFLADDLGYGDIGVITTHMK